MPEFELEVEQQTTEIAVFCVEADTMVQARKIAEQQVKAGRMAFLCRKVRVSVNKCHGVQATPQ